MEAPTVQGHARLKLFDTSRLDAYADLLEAACDAANAEEAALAAIRDSPEGRAKLMASVAKSWAEAEGVPYPLTPRPLQFQCVTLLLRSAASFDADSRRYLAETLVDVCGLDGIIAQMRDAECVAGLAYLPARDDLSLVDDLRRRLAERPKTARKTFEPLSQRIIPDACAADVAIVARALLGDGRYRRDMVGAPLPKAAQDLCRRLRNRAAKIPAPPPPPPPRLHAPRGGHPTRGPWFPGYEH